MVTAQNRLSMFEELNEASQRRSHIRPMFAYFHAFPTGIIRPGFAKIDGSAWAAGPIADSRIRRLTGARVTQTGLTRGGLSLSRFLGGRLWEVQGGARRAE